MRFMNSKSIKSLSIGLFVALFICFIVLVAPLSEVQAQTEKERVAKLIEGAKKRGAIGMVYNYDGRRQSTIAGKISGKVSLY